MTKPVLNDYKLAELARQLDEIAQGHNYSSLVLQAAAAFATTAAEREALERFRLGNPTRLADKFALQELANRIRPANPPGYDPDWRNRSPGSIRRCVLDRDDLSQKDVDDLFEEAAEGMAEGVEPEDCLMDVFGLEPDYIFDAEFLRAVRRARYS